MDIVKTLVRRGRHYIAVFGTLFALVLSTIVPGLASAAQLTSRSIALSSSSEGASNVTYTVNFTAIAPTAGGIVIDFCNNSSLQDDACTAPSGFSASSALSTGLTLADSANRIVITDPITAGAVSIPITGITNPTSVTDPLYARIATFDTSGHAVAYAAAEAGGFENATGHEDNGGVSIAITNTVGVSAAVQESMLFCVSGQAISSDCTGTSLPNITLGHAVGTSFALSPTAVDTGSIYTQLSTNALHGAIVNLKSNATGCGGLLLAGDTAHCYIPAATGTLAAGTAGFGVETNTATGTGTYEPYPSSGYSNTTYNMNYVAGDATGVTSTYGDPLLTTNGTRTNNADMTLQFGAAVSNDTPAGNYSADLSLIATGTF